MSRSQRAAITSLVAGLLIFSAKMTAWALTDSAALLADALESIVNVVAAIAAIYAIRFAAQAVDEDHPYGHGKAELLAAAFEGGLVAAAAVASAWQAIRALIDGAAPKELDVGMLVAGGAAAANLLLGAWLVRVGRKEQSPTLIADGTHVLSDVWTTAGAIVALGIVRFTGLTWIDPIVALLLSLLLVKTGYGLVREAADGLLDREDRTLLGKIVEAFNAAKVPGMHGMHRLRAIRSGRFVHVDAHVYTPADWTIAVAHVAVERLEREIVERAGIQGEIALHLDPLPPGTSPDAIVTVESATKGV